MLNQKLSKNRYIPWQLATFLAAVDFSMLCFAYGLNQLVLGFLNRFVVYFWNTPVPFPLSDQTSYYLILFMCAVSYFGLKMHYRSRIPWFSQVGSIARLTFGFLLLDLFASYYAGHPAFPYSQLLLWTFSAILLLIGRSAALFSVKRMPSWAVPVVLIGSAQTLTHALNGFASDGNTGYQVAGLVLLGGEKDSALSITINLHAHSDTPLLTSSEQALTFMQSHRDMLYFVDMGALARPEQIWLKGYIQSHDGNWSYLPSAGLFDLYHMETHSFFGNDLVILHPTDKIHSFVGRVFKRGLDIFCSSLSLPLLFTIMATLYIYRKIHKTDVPLFYGGARVGKNGKLFSCWKFCTMYRNADQILQQVLDSDEKLKREWESFAKLKNDPRIDSPISAFLRKTSLDELPQLWNVFVGDMSLVGPRPILPEQDVQYGEEDLKNYYTVRPGLTGLWQVSGRNETTFEQRVYWDRWYIKNWSFWHDIVIVFKTVKVFVTGYGAY